MIFAPKQIPYLRVIYQTGPVEQVRTPPRQGSLHCHASGPLHVQKTNKGFISGQKQYVVHEGCQELVTRILLLHNIRIIALYFKPQFR